MSTLKKLLYACSILFLQSCNQPLKEREQPADASGDMTAIAMQQEAIMDSVITAEEIEFAQQAVTKQQQMDLTLKPVTKKSWPGKRPGFKPLTASVNQTPK